MTFLTVEVDTPNRKRHFRGVGQRNVITYEKNVALRCGCSVPAAE